MFQKRSKYGAKKTTIKIDNVDVVFDSKIEAKRYDYLKQKLDLGEISNLTRQPVFELQPSFKFNGNTIRKIEYRADFSYVEAAKEVIEDVKGMLTPEYKLKAKLLLHQFHKEGRNIVFKEVTWQSKQWQEKLR